jgi:hypothetical protein
MKIPTYTVDLVKERELISSDQKCLVLGSCGYAGVSSTEWDSNDLPNIVDFDVVIVDVRALDEKKLSNVSNEQFEDYRSQLTRLLHSNGRIIVLSDFRKNYNRPDEYPEHTSNYAWCPVEIGIKEESGNSLLEINKRFPSYLKHLRNWSYYFYIPSACLSAQLTDFYGSTGKYQYNLPMTSFIRNRYKQTIAGSFVIEVTGKHEGSSRYRSYNPDSDESFFGTGEIVLLPLIEQLDHKEAVCLVLEDLIGKSQAYAPPDWVDSIVIPQTKEIETEIETKQKRIEDISKDVENLNRNLESLNAYRRLLYSSGFDLEEIVKRCFVELGAKVTPAQYGEEEYILEYEGNEYLVEVKGNTKSISLTNLRQLNDYTLKFEEEEKKTCKGILFGNSWRNLPPEERNTSEKPEFPDNVIARAKKFEIALISSVKFYEAFCLFLKDGSKGAIILHDLINADGLVEFEINKSDE